MLSTVIIVMLVILTAYTISENMRYRSSHEEENEGKTDPADVEKKQDKFSIGISFNITVALPKKRTQKETQESEKATCDNDTFITELREKEAEAKEGC